MLSDRSLSMKLVVRSDYKNQPIFISQQHDCWLLLSDEFPMDPLLDIMRKIRDNIDSGLSVKHRYLFNFQKKALDNSDVLCYNSTVGRC